MHSCSALIENFARMLSIDGKWICPLQVNLLMIIIIAMVKPAAPIIRLNGISEMTTKLNRSSIFYDPNDYFFNTTKYHYRFLFNFNMTTSNIVFMHQNESLNLYIHYHQEGAFWFFSQDNQYVKFHSGGDISSHDVKKHDYWGFPIGHGVELLRLTKPYTYCATLTTFNPVGQVRAHLSYMASATGIIESMNVFVFIVRTKRWIGYCCALGWFSNLAWAGVLWFPIADYTSTGTISGISFLFVTLSWAAYVILFMGQYFLLYDSGVHMDIYLRNFDHIRKPRFNVLRLNEICCGISQQAPLFYPPYGRIFSPVTEKDIFYSVHGIICTSVLIYVMVTHEKSRYYDLAWGGAGFGTFLAFSFIVLSMMSSRDYENLIYKGNILDFCSLSTYFHGLLLAIRHLFQINLIKKRKLIVGTSSFYFIPDMFGNICYLIKLALTGLNFDDFTLSGETFRFAHGLIAFLMDIVIMVLIALYTQDSENVPKPDRKKQVKNVAGVGRFVPTHNNKYIEGINDQKFIA